MQADLGLYIDINAYPANIFILLLLSAFYICCIYSSALDSRFFFMKANTTNPDSPAHNLGAV